MSCAETIPKLELMADDELTSEQAATILSHIDECASCRDNWYSLLALRQTIKDKAASFVPEGGFAALEDRLITAVRKEDWQTRSNSRKYEGPIRAAAALLLLVVAAAIYGATGGFAELDKQNLPLVAQKDVTQKPPIQVQSIATDTTAPVSLEDALSNFDQFLAKPPLVRPAATADELARLSQQVGFAVKPMQLPGFKLAGCQIVASSPGKSNMVRLCYSRINGKGNDSIMCYQAAGGKLVAKGLNEHFIDGRKICCGETQNKSIVFIPGQKDNSNETLLVGTISKSDLMDLVLSSS